MNQQENQPMQTAKPAVSKWLWITLIIVVLIAGGYFGWYYLSGPGKKVATTATPTTTAATTPTTTTTTTTTTPATTTSATVDEATQKKEICNTLYPDAKYDTTNVKVGDSTCNVIKTQNNYAVGGVHSVAEITNAGPGGPGFAWIAEKINNSWTKITSGQDNLDCSIMKKYSFPSALYIEVYQDNKCYNPDTKTTEIYQL